MVISDVITTDMINPFKTGPPDFCEVEGGGGVECCKYTNILPPHF